VRDEEPTKIPISEDQKILESAKIWFGPQDEFQIPNALDISSRGRVQTKKINWDNAIIHAGGKIIEVQVDYNFHAVPTRGEKSESKIAQKQKDAFYRLILISDGFGGYKKSMLKFFSEESKAKQKNLTENSFLKLSPDYSGTVRLFTWDEQFLQGWNVEDGRVVKYISPINQKGKKSTISYENLSQNGCSGSFVEEYYCYYDGNILDCTQIFVMECEEEQNYDESPEGGANDSPTWSQNNWNGYWPGNGSIPLGDLFFTTLTPDDDYTYSGEKRLIPELLSLGNGENVIVEFGITESDRKSANQEVAELLIEGLKSALKKANSNLGSHEKILKIYVAATTNGGHGSTSNHYNGTAIDISRINGAKMALTGVTNQITQLQIAMDDFPNVRENFGPSFKHKFSIESNNWNYNHPVKGHGDHIHFSVRN
jgi:hypothetical protein